MPVHTGTAWSHACVPKVDERASLAVRGYRLLCAVQRAPVAVKQVLQVVTGGRGATAPFHPGRTTPLAHQLSPPRGLLSEMPATDLASASEATQISALASAAARIPRRRALDDIGGRRGPKGSRRSRSGGEVPLSPREPVASGRTRTASVCTAAPDPASTPTQRR